MKPVKKGRGRPKKAELTTGTKQTTRKVYNKIVRVLLFYSQVKRSAAKKTTVTSKKLLQSDQDSDESEGHEDEGEEHAVTAPVIEVISEKGLLRSSFDCSRKLFQKEEVGHLRRISLKMRKLR